MIYEITLAQQFYGVQVINRWNYLSTGTPVGVTGAFALLSAMGFIATDGDLVPDTIGGLIQGLQQSDVTFQGVLSKAIREAPTDFYDYGYPAGVVGAGSGSQSMSPINAYGLYTNRVRTDIARGTKRFVGVVEGSVAPGGVLETAAQTYLQSIADAMTDTLSYTDGGNSLTFAPIIVQKQKTTDVDGKVKYNYYSTIAAQLEHIAQGIVWSIYPNVRSQVSRQYKHGA